VKNEDGKQQEKKKTQKLDKKRKLAVLVDEYYDDMAKYGVPEDEIDPAETIGRGESERKITPQGPKT